MPGSASDYEAGGLEDRLSFKHEHRYCLARDFVAGKDVLNIGSAGGRGAVLLADVARSVVGLEIDPRPVRHAQTAYDQPNLRFLQGEAARIPLPDACVDVVVSLETLDEVPDQDAFLREIRRVLRPHGLLLIFAPACRTSLAPDPAMRAVQPPASAASHFADLLARHFLNQSMLAQRAVIGSVLAPIAGDAGGWRSFDRRGGEVIEAQPGLSQAFGLVALASDAPLPPVGSSLFAHDVSLDDLLAVADTAASRERARADIEQAWREAERRESSTRREALALVAKKETALAAARLEAANLLSQIEVIRTSTLWRALGPFRQFGRRFPAVARFGGRAVRVSYWTLTGQLRARLRDRRALRTLTMKDLAELRAAWNLPADPGPAPTPGEIRLPAPGGKPRISVIIPTYGQVDFTLRCLASIAAAPPEASVEVIVVDDCSDEPGVTKLAQVQGLRLIRWPSNLGFLRSCNAAAQQAEGEFLFFLNNDTQLMPGAIDALLRLLEARPDAGMAGSKLIYPDGRLQEAGGIVWRDGSAWNYGSGQDPRRPEFSYVREVDYISGAAIMLPRARWEEMGGFDETFLPAYCEDSDLAFRLRKAGWKVLFQPASVVVHHEGASHGTDTNAGVKAHQVANTQKLFQRWQETLGREALPSGERVMRARDRSLGKRVTLVVDHYVPEPDRDAGSRTMLAFMEALLASDRVVKFLPANMRRTPGYTEALEQRGIEVAGHPWAADLDAWLMANGGEVDEVLLSRPSVAVPLLAKLRARCKAPIVFYGHDLHFARMMLEPGAEEPAKRERIAQMEAQERRIWRLVDVALYPSEEEAARVRALEPGVRARGVPAYALPRRPAPNVAPPGAPAGRVVFVGGFRHTPNEDAALWLAKEIMPLLRRRVPGVTLTIIGSSPTPAVLALEGEGVTVLGFVSDEELEVEYAEARVALCPLRFGAGVKLKVVEAMHRGVPVVTTPVGAQGLPGLPAICDIADTADALADAAARLLTEDARWLERSAGQSGYVMERFSFEAMRTSLVDAFEEARAER